MSVIKSRLLSVYVLQSTYGGIITKYVLIITQMSRVLKIPLTKFLFSYLPLLRSACLCTIISKIIIETFVCTCHYYQQTLPVSTRTVTALRLILPGITESSQEESIERGWPNHSTIICAHNSAFNPRMPKENVSNIIKNAYLPTKNNVDCKIGCA